MSKLLKRTLALALIFCLVLSVIPAVNAAVETAPSDNYTYEFFDKTLGSEIKYSTITSTDKYGWKFLGSSLGSSTLGDKCLTFNPTWTSHWLALIINVPEAGVYDVSLGYACGGRPGDFAIFKYDPESMTNIVGASLGLHGQTAYMNTAPLRAIVDLTYTVPDRIGFDTGAAYIGQMEFDAGEYVLMMKPQSYAGENAGTSLNYLRINKLILTKPNAANHGFIAAMNENPNTGDPRDLQGAWGQLCAPFTYTGTVALLDKTNLDLRGYSLTADAVTTVSTSKVTDSVGTGSINAATMTLAANNVLFPLKTAENTYKFFADTTAMYTEPKAAIGIEDASAKAFGFNIDLPEAAFDCDFSNVSVTLDVVVEGHTASVLCDYTSEDSVNGGVAEWAAAKGEKAFFVNIANYDLLAGETLQFRVTVASNGVAHTTTGTYTVPAAE